jgi:hypothetical protein
MSKHFSIKLIYFQKEMKFSYIFLLIFIFKINGNLIVSSFNIQTGRDEVLYIIFNKIYKRMEN